jgi:hypothetical protein
MLNKIKDIIQNLKVKFIYYQIKILFKEKEFLFKWLELKTGIINSDEFNMWLTKSLD